MVLVTNVLPAVSKQYSLSLQCEAERQKRKLKVKVHKDFIVHCFIQKCISFDSSLNDI